MASSRSIRFKITALLVIPLLSLAALWVFGTSVTTRESASMLAVASLYANIGKPGDDLAIGMQREHMLTSEWLGSRSPERKAAVSRQREVVDGLRDRFRELALTDSAQEDLSTPAMRTRFDEMLVMIGRLDAARSAVDAGVLDQAALTVEYGRFPDAMQRLIAAMTVANDLPLYQQSRAVTAMGYSKDFLSRERGLAAGVLIAGRPLSPDEYRAFAQLATTRRFLFSQGMSDLEPALRAPFEELERSQEYQRFLTLEEQILADQGRTFPHTVWRQAADDIEAYYQSTLTRSSDALAASAEPAALATFVRAGLAGVLGLVAVIVSVVVAFRVGRGLTRELGELRDTAAELADVRLPRLIQRLRRGEEVDVDVEAPPLAVTGSTTEIRDLSAAFAGVRRTAVEAAVEQATLRDAVGKALRNLARRSQTLLQRQLKLLDAMQRRIEDPETLRELFRADHLTTRMRRQAEGLVILSGGSPGRTFAREVPLADVVRAAVAEVEDYTRVHVFPMPEVALKGDAAADVIHLCAELIENATVFSPPSTEVSVRAEPAARGIAIEVEDRGLGMSPEQRDAVNEKLARPPEFEAAGTERLGLHVTARLAARHGIRIELRGSPYGGTTAIVLLPDTLAATATPREVTPAPVPWPAHQAAQPQQPVTTATAGKPLPRRVRQAHLAPQLKNKPEAEPAAAEGPEQPAGTSPEHSRALLNSMQAGWRRGRTESERDGEEV
ncbi:nitrate- and nitrite sensing domain-containing protein [Sphaerisporangium aureirubrum]|uniref:histidine kinase n=1 Tax=Sphaerisporangium aureirubrum TaxID=1544736 RepID=A0ABW1NCQ9_9ACTN